MGKAKFNCATAFHSAIRSWMDDSSILTCPEDRYYKRIKGVLTSEEYRAQIEIVFSPYKFREEAPVVFCNEPWLTRDLNWHCFKAASATGAWANDYRLCWIHPFEWRLANSNPRKRMIEITREGSNWLHNNVAKLLDRHWLGHTLGIKAWRPEWGGWSHGSEGNSEIIEEVKTNGRPSNWIKV